MTFPLIEDIIHLIGEFFIEDSDDVVTLLHVNKSFYLTFYKNPICDICWIFKNKDIEHFIPKYMIKIVIFINNIVDLKFIYNVVKLVVHHTQETPKFVLDKYLKECKNLRTLLIFNAYIEDASNISPKLKKLAYHTRNIIKNLHKLENLTYLDARFDMNGISRSINSIAIYDKSTLVIRKKLIHLQYISINLDTHIGFQNKDLELLNHLKYLNISHTKISDLTPLTDVHTLELNYCPNITDFSALKGTRSLYIRGCRQIVDKNLKSLNNLHLLDAQNCENITNDGLKYLTKIKVLYLGNCNPKITSEYLKSIKNADLVINKNIIYVGKMNNNTDIDDIFESYEKKYSYMQDF